MFGRLEALRGSVNIFMYWNCLMHCLKIYLPFLTLTLGSLWDSSFVKTQNPWSQCRSPSAMAVISNSNFPGALETLVQINSLLFFVKNSFTPEEKWGVFSLYLQSTTHLDWGFPGGSAVETLPVKLETRDWSLGQRDPLEKEMTAHSSILAWEIPWTEEPGGLQSMGLQRVGHDWAAEHEVSRPHIRQRLLVVQVLVWSPLLLISLSVCFLLLPDPALAFGSRLLFLSQLSKHVWASLLLVDVTPALAQEPQLGAITAFARPGPSCCWKVTSSASFWFPSQQLCTVDT